PAFRMPSPQKLHPARHSLGPAAGSATEPGGSQVSPASRMPSPHSWSVQLLRHASASLLLPSSHCSPASRCPSPHTVQSARQVLLFGPAGCPGGSQVSPGGLRRPSPQTGSTQLLRQASVSTLSPSSHCSPASTWPSPHTVQLARQVLLFGPAGDPGGSQVSPGVFPRMPSPHFARRQALVHE